jgi:hypothetical protein
LQLFSRVEISINTNGLGIRYRVRVTARRVTHLQFDISANVFEIRAVLSPKCMSDMLLTVQSRSNKKLMFEHLRRTAIGFRYSYHLSRL